LATSARGRRGEELPDYICTRQEKSGEGGREGGKEGGREGRGGEGREGRGGKGKGGRGVSGSARMLECVCADRFLPLRMVKIVSWINVDACGRLDEMDVRTGNFTVGHPFRYPCHTANISLFLWLPLHTNPTNSPIYLASWEPQSVDGRNSSNMDED
jgi:hypothetical protein